MSQCLDDNLALELIDGKLPSARRAAVERHIESCDACRELVVTLTKTDEAEPQVDTQRAAGTQAALSSAGPYRVEREVGSGAAGTVFRAVDDRTGQVVALKYVTDPGWRSRFAREVETLARLIHPGIVRYISHGETRQGLYLAMEWLDGEDLAHAMDRGPLPWPAVRLLGLRLTAALAHAHALGAVHRDIGPRNIFLPGGRLEQAKLLDFGLVRVQDTLDRTASQAVLGTPHYMAPEQVRDPRTVDARSDLFALGVVFYEALAGRRPFEAEDLFTVWSKIVDQPAPDLRALAPTVPEGFVTLIERMMQKEPSARPPNAAAVHEALVRLDAPTSSAGGVSTAVTPPLQRSAPLPSAPAPAAAPTFQAPPGPARSEDPALTPAPSQPRYTPPPPSPWNTAPPPTYQPSPFPVATGSGPYTLAPAVTSPPHALPPSGPASARQGGQGGVILAAALVVAGAIVLLGAAIVLGPHFLKETSLASGGAKPPPAGAPAPPAELEAPGAEEPTAPPASKPAPAPRGGKPVSPPPRVPERFNCGGEAVEHRRGGFYAAEDPNDAVMVANQCHAVLEDCVISGPKAINLLAKGQLTLRRCKVTGRTQLVGEGPLLILEGTTLATAPSIVGRGRVIQR